MLFMIVEHFKNKDAQPVYQRFREKGRMIPDGLRYIDSWTTDDMDRCFQLMETDDPHLIQLWIKNWDDLVDFEVVKVMTSKQAADRSGT